jgi:polyhydroxyalkanoate synthase
MSKTTDPFAPAMQQFAQAGQAMAQQFFSFLGSPAAQNPLGGSPIQMGAPDPEKLSALQQNFIQQQSQLWNAMLARGKEAHLPLRCRLSPATAVFPPRSGSRARSSTISARAICSRRPTRSSSRQALETKGESIHPGHQNLLGDLEKGRISMTDDSAFEVGRNLALTPGRGGLRKRADAADPVFAADRQGRASARS